MIITKIHLLLIVIVITMPNITYSQTTNLITFNIKYDNKLDSVNNWEYRKHKLVELLKHYDPAFVGTQEGLVNQIKFIDSALSNYSYIGVGRDDGKTLGEYCAIYFDTTKYILIKESTFWLSETPDTVSVGWDAALERICTYGLFEDKNSQGRIWIFNTHFDHIGVIARNKSTQLIIEKMLQINSDQYPLVLMGDFNLTPEEKPIQFLKTKLNDALDISAKPLYGPLGTFNNFSDEIIDQRIDYFFTYNLKVLSYSHIDDRTNSNKHVSDHLPVLIKISQ